MLSAGSTWASPAREGSAREEMFSNLEDAKHALLDRYGVAVMIQASSENSIPTANPIYQLLLGKLQREMRKADFLVFNAVLPENTVLDEGPDSSFQKTFARLDNPYLDTVLVVNMKVDGRLRNDASELALEVTVQFVDVVTGQAFATLDEASSIRISDTCDVSCLEHSLNR